MDVAAEKRQEKPPHSHRPVCEEGKGVPVDPLGSCLKARGPWFSPRARFSPADSHRPWGGAPAAHGLLRNISWGAGSRSLARQKEGLSGKGRSAQEHMASQRRKMRNTLQDFTERLCRQETLGHTRVASWKDKHTLPNGAP